jgi:hypothetical protein
MRDRVKTNAPLQTIQLLLCIFALVRLTPGKSYDANALNLQAGSRQVQDSILG